METRLINRDGERIMDDGTIWRFPRVVSIEKVSEYDDHLKQIKYGETIIFDLSDTVKVHSSFIGYLIHAKHSINKNGGRLVLSLSLTLEKILILLNIIDHFSPDIITSVKKTA
jgi:anti-anti-sigma regulatory factor